MDWLSAITNVVGWFAGTNQKGYGEDPNFTGGGGGSAQTGSGFLGLIKTGASMYSASQKDPYVGAADTSMFSNVRPRSIEKLTRGQPAAGGLSPSLERLYQNPAVMQALQHYQQNGARDVNMQSMLNEAGIVKPTSRQGMTKTLATKSPDLKSEINVG